MERLVLTLPAMVFTVAVLYSQDRHPLNQLLTLRAQYVRRGLLKIRKRPTSSSPPLIGRGCSDRERYHPIVGSQSTDFATEDPHYSPAGNFVVCGADEGGASRNYREVSSVSRPDLIVGIQDYQGNGTKWHPVHPGCSWRFFQKGGT